MTANVIDTKECMPPIVFFQDASVLLLENVKYLVIEQIHIKIRGDEKNFQSTKELFGPEEFNLVLAILNSEAPNYSED